jgi:hypothetical protein
MDIESPIYVICEVFVIQLSNCEIFKGTLARFSYSETRKSIPTEYFVEFSFSDYPGHEGLEACNKRALGNASDGTRFW